MDILDRIVAIAVPWDVILPYLIPDTGNSSVSGSLSNCMHRLFLIYFKKRTSE